MNKSLKIFLVSLALNGLFFNSFVLAQAPKIKCSGDTGANLPAKVVYIDVIANPERGPNDPIKYKKVAGNTLTDKQKKRCDLMLGNAVSELNRQSKIGSANDERLVASSLASALESLRKKCLNGTAADPDPFEKQDIIDLLLSAITSGISSAHSLYPKWLTDMIAADVSQDVGRVADALRGYIYGDSQVKAGGSAALDAINTALQGMKKTLQDFLINHTIGPVKGWFGY